MEATELMIGDVVYVTPDKTGRVCTVNRSNTGNAFVLVKDERYTHSLVNITPIPLTPEILKKNGIGDIEDDEFASAYIESFEKPQFQFCKNINLLIGTDYKGRFWVKSILNTIDDIRYVHELQHALRMCGQNDLADNFSV